MQTRPDPPPSLSRRRTLVLLGAGAVSSLMRRSFADIPTARGGLEFRILRQGSEIGRHRVAFLKPDRQSLEVITEIEVDVQLAFITVYSFRQRVAELWQDGRMRRADIRIESQGEVREWLVVANDDGLELRAGSMRRMLPADCLTDIDFWNSSITRRTWLLDTWTGEVIPVAVERGPVERIDLGAIAVSARRFHLRANRGRSGTVWYTDDGTWVRGRLLTRGESLDYLPSSAPILAQSGQM